MNWHSPVAALLVAAALPLLANCANGGLFGGSDNDMAATAAPPPSTTQPGRAMTANTPAPAMLQSMMNKSVYGMDGQLLGKVTRVDAAMNVVEIQLPSGARVGVFANNLQDAPGRVNAPRVTRDQIVALASRQAGHMVAFQ